MQMRSVSRVRCACRFCIKIRLFFSYLYTQACGTEIFYTAKGDHCMSQPFKTEVITRKLPIEQLKLYLSPEETLAACEACPEYGKRWCCPPGVPDPYTYLSPYSEAFLIGVKVIYSEEIRAQSREMASLDQLQDSLFHKVEHQVQCILLELEHEFPHSVSISTCLMCRRCARKDDLPCRYLNLMRYNLTAMGFRFTDLVKNEFGLELQWVDKGLPEYHLMVSALLIK